MIKDDLLSERKRSASTSGIEDTSIARVADTAEDTDQRLRRAIQAVEEAEAVSADTLRDLSRNRESLVSICGFGAVCS